MTDTKFCKDCKHFIPREFQGTIMDKCSAHGSTNLVNGIFINNDCVSERYLGDCGKEAKYFEPKEHK